MGEYNYFFYMPEGVPNPLAKRKKKVPHGTVTRYKVDTDEYAVGKKRKVYLYDPPTDQPCPLLVVWDGKDYLNQAKLANQVDNLIAYERIRPIAIAFVYSSEEAREVEYSCNEASLALITEKVVPLADENLDLLSLKQFPGSYGILGASMGGTMAMFAGMRLPDIFGSVLSQSGSFDYYGDNSLLFDLIRLSKTMPVKIWMDVGQYEELIESNKRMHEILLSKGYTVVYREFAGGHNYAAWKDDIWHGLEYMYGI